VLDPRRLIISSIRCAVFTSEDRTETTTISEGTEHPIWLYSIVTKSVMVSNQIQVLHSHGGWGACGTVVVKALCYKPWGCGFETRWGKFFQLT
jgi:hypothetical protein